MCLSSNLQCIGYITSTILNLLQRVWISPNGSVSLYHATIYRERGVNTYTSHMYPNTHATRAYTHMCTLTYIRIYEYTHTYILYIHTDTCIHIPTRSHTSRINTAHTTYIHINTHTHSIKQNTHIHIIHKHKHSHRDTITHYTQLDILTHRVIYRKRNKVRITHTLRGMHTRRERGNLHMAMGEFGCGLCCMEEEKVTRLQWQRKRPCHRRSSATP